MAVLSWWSDVCLFKSVTNETLACKILSSMILTRLLLGGTFVSLTQRSLRQ